LASAEGVEGREEASPVDEWDFVFFFFLVRVEAAVMELKIVG